MTRLKSPAQRAPIRALFAARTLSLIAACVLSAGIAGESANARPSAAASNADATPADTAIKRSEDFDFLRGDWRVHNRRLKNVLQRSDDWTEFGARHHGAPLMDGLANYDELRLDDGTLLGLSFRTFDRGTRQWSIRWVAERDGVLQPALTGRFVDGVGIFEGDDVLGGRKIRVRYRWTGTRTATPRWQQAFSADGGRTWETNWTMDFSREPPRRSSDGG